MGARQHIDIGLPILGKDLLFIQVLQQSDMFLQMMFFYIFLQAAEMFFVKAVGNFACYRQMQRIFAEQAFYCLYHHKVIFLFQIFPDTENIYPAVFEITFIFGGYFRFHQEGGKKGFLILD